MRRRYPEMRRPVAVKAQGPRLELDMDNFSGSGVGHLVDLVDGVRVLVVRYSKVGQDGNVTGAVRLTDFGIRCPGVAKITRLDAS